MGFPTAAHVVYIPFVLLFGIAIGFVLGGRAARDAAAARAERERLRELRRKQVSVHAPTPRSP